MDIVERLRQEIGGYTDVHLEKTETDMREAADEIEQLREYIKNWKDTDSAAIMALKQAQEEVNRLRSERDELKKTAFMKDVIGGANWKAICKENERQKELLQHWLGCCFVDSHNDSVSFGMGVKKVWLETRALLRGESDGYC